MRSIDERCSVTYQLAGFTFILSLICIVVFFFVHLRIRAGQERLKQVERSIHKQPLIDEIISETISNASTTSI